MIENGCCTGQRAAALAVFLQKIRPGHLAVNGALKTDAVFSLRQDPCKAGLMPQAEQGICTQTLCSRHTRGVLSRALAGALVSQAPAQKAGNEIRFFDRSVRYKAKRSACSVHGKGKFHSSAPLHCAVTADAGLPLFTRERAGAAGSFGVSAAA